MIDSVYCPSPSSPSSPPSTTAPSAARNPTSVAGGGTLAGDAMPDVPCLPCFRRSGSVESPDLEPVLLVSGIGGSILNAKSKKTGCVIRAWVRIFLANIEFRRCLWSIYNPETGYTEPVDENVEIVVPDDDYGLYALDILDPSLLTKIFHLREVYQFHDMIEMLVKCGYEKGKTLFGFAYDFRQSNRIDKSMDSFKKKLVLAYEASGGRKVNIISHSMGGLLILCFLSLFRDVFTKYVNKWICIACPFQGAPGCINDSLLTGLQFVYGFESYFFVSRWTMHQLLVECPSIYEMLPNPNFKWKQQPVIQVWRKQLDDKEAPAVKLDTYGSSSSVELFQEALRNNVLDYNGNTFPLPFNFSILKWAADTRKILDNTQLPESVSFFNIYGVSCDTPFDVCYGSEASPIVDLSDICHSLPQYTYVDGDGTVPAESAKADGLDAVERVGVKDSHRELLCNKKVFHHIKRWLGVSQQLPQSSKVADCIET